MRLAWIALAATAALAACIPSAPSEPTVWVPCTPEGVCAEGVRLVLEDGDWVCDYGEVVGWEADELTCDGLDNDCDGETDEPLAAAEGDGCLLGGPCAGAVWLACDGDARVCDYSAVVGREADGEVSCDGVDNDCDGTTDEPEQLVAPEAICPTAGVCAGAAAATCAKSGWTCELPDPAEVAFESDVEVTCDGLDNDCDGVTDEGLGERSAPSTCLQGLPPQCGLNHPLSLQTCTGGAWVCVGGYEDGDEVTCDGLDNDCDGVTDEGMRTELVELSCDGVDNDCDGVTDGVSSDLLFPSCRLAGVCAGRGVGQCDASGWACTVDDGGPPMEGDEATCDWLDNDCDGFTDEGALCAECAPLAPDCVGDLMATCDAAGGDPFLELCPDGMTCLGPGHCGVETDLDAFLPSATYVAAGAAPGWVAAVGETVFVEDVVLAATGLGLARWVTLSPDGDKSGGQVSASDPSPPSIAVGAADGSATLIVWAEAQPTGKGRVVGSTGTSDESFEIAEWADGVGAPSVAAGEAEFAVVWPTADGVSVAFQDRDAPSDAIATCPLVLPSAVLPAGLEVLDEPVVAPTPDGAFLVALVARDAAGLAGAVLGQRLTVDACTALLDDPILVSDRPHDLAPLSVPSRPAVAATGDHLFVAWDRALAGAHQPVVRRLETLACPGEVPICAAGGEVPIGPPAADPRRPLLSALPGGRAVVGLPHPDGALAVTTLGRWGAPSRAPWPLVPGELSGEVGLVGLAGDRVVAVATSGEVVQRELTCPAGQPFCTADGKRRICDDLGRSAADAAGGCADGLVCTGPGLCSDPAPTPVPIPDGNEHHLHRPDVSAVDGMVVISQVSTWGAFQPGNENVYAVPYTIEADGGLTPQQVVDVEATTALSEDARVVAVAPDRAALVFDYLATLGSCFQVVTESGGAWEKDWAIALAPCAKPGADGRIARLPGGHVARAWRNGTAKTHSLEVRHVDAAPASDPLFLEEREGNHAAALAALPDGRIVQIVHEETTLLLRHFEPVGAPDAPDGWSLADERVLTTSSDPDVHPEVAATDGGRVAVVWRSPPLDAHGLASTMVGVVTPAGDLVAGPQGGIVDLGPTADHLEPSVAALPGGDVVVLWRTDLGEAGQEIWGRRISPDVPGAWYPAVRLVEHPDVLERPRAVALPDGRLLLVWAALETKSSVRYRLLGAPETW